MKNTNFLNNSGLPKTIKEKTLNLLNALNELMSTIEEPKKISKQALPAKKPVKRSRTKRSFTRTRVDKILQGHENEFFNVKFIKRTDGTERSMTCRLGVTSRLTGGVPAYDAKDKNLLVVFDTQKKGYRSIPIENILTMTVAGVTHYRD